jgi:HEAT repeat protein
MKPSLRDEYKNGRRPRRTPRPAAADPRPTAELVRLAQAAADEEAQWEYIWILQRRGTPDVVIVAQGLCRSADPEERALGADILGQAKLKDPALQEQALAVLLDLLECDDDPDVLSSAAVALGHRHDPRAIAPLLRLKDHPATDVRYGVVHGLAGYDDPRAVAALIELSSDSEARVRDWATFELGCLTDDLDTPAIRAALRARLDDWHEDTRGEVFRGLAQYGDPGLVSPLLRELAAPGVGHMVIEAAVELGLRTRDPRLYPALVRAQPLARSYLAEDVEEALKLCWNPKP